jgi:hypothetical protein
MMPLIDCLINGTRYSKSGKSVSIRGERNEQVLFFKIDGCYISSSESKKSDLLVIYSDSEWRFLILVELKGKKIEDAIEQFRQTIQNERFRYIFNKSFCRRCNNDKCVKLFVIVHGGGISISSDLENELKEEYGFYLETIPENCDLGEIIKKYKEKYEEKYEKHLKKMRKKRKKK